MVFTTPHFSDYVIVYEGTVGGDITPTPGPEDDNDSDDSNDDASNNAEDTTITTEASSQPSTGDNSNVLFWIILSMIALAGAAVVSIVYFKKFK